MDSGKTGKKSFGRAKRGTSKIEPIRSRTAYWIKLVLIGILLVVTELVTYLIVLQNYAQSLKQEYEKSLVFNFSGYNSAINADFSAVFDDFDACFDDESFSAYARGFVNENRTLTVVRDGETKHYDLNSSDFANVAEHRLSFSTLRYLSGLNIPSDEPLAVLSHRSGAVWRLLFLDRTRFLKNSDRYGFDSFSILDRNRKVLFGGFAENAGAFQTLVLPSDLEKSSATLLGSVAGIAGIAVVAPLNADGGYWLAGFRNDASLVGAVSSVTSDVLIAMLLSVFLSVAFTVLAAVVYTKKQDFIYGYNVATKDFYVVYTDNLGNIRRANREFKSRFPAKNLFEAENLDSKFHQLAMHDNYIVKLPDKDGQPVILNFLATKTTRGFKFAGVEGADVTDYFVNQNETPFLDKATSLYNLRKLEMDYSAFRGAGRRVVGAVKLSDLTLYGTLFGRKFFGQIRQVFANRMRARFQDIAKVYIVASDTFAVYLDEEENIAALLRDVAREMSDLNLAVKHGENVVKVTVKAGFAIVDAGEKADFETVSARYEAALGRAQDSDQDYFVFHESQREFYRKYFKKEIDLDALIEKKSLSLFYQPQLDLKTNKICGFEALLRLKSAENLDLDVYELIRYAEETGQMVKLGDFVFREGMRFAAELNDPSIEVSLNVSPVQLMQAGFTDDLIRMIRGYGLPEHSISLEVTESFMMSDVETSILKFRLLKDAGVDIRLDDFGMGYSSLRYLKELPVSYIKIDREFIRDAETNEYSESIVRTILTLAKNLGLKCVAEGVETESQRRLLETMGCDLIQGYYISKAVSEDRVRELLYRYNRASELGADPVGEAER